MVETTCPHCGTAVSLPNLYRETECPACQTVLQPHEHIPVLKRQIQELETEMDRLQSKKSVFARSKGGAVKAKIAALEEQIAVITLGASSHSSASQNADQQAGSERDGGPDKERRDNDRSIKR